MELRALVHDTAFTEVNRSEWEAILPGRDGGGNLVSKQEAVLAYLKGSIGRREFIQRLSVAGVSTAAAVTYASALKPGSAAASGGSSSGGFRMAFQEDDYGTGTEEPTEEPTTPVDEALEALAAAINALIDGLSEQLEAIVALLASLGITGAIADAATANLEQAIANLQEQLASLGLTRTPSSLSSVRALQGTSPDVLSRFSDVFNVLAGIYSNILQATTDVSEANRIAPFGIVAGRQAAYFSTLLGDIAFPNSSEPITTPEELQAALDAAS